MFFHNGWLWYRHAWLSPEPSHSLESLLLHFPAYCFGSDACSASRTRPWRYRTGAALDLNVKSRNSQSVSLSLACGMAESIPTRPWSGELIEDNLQCLKFILEAKQVTRCVTELAHQHLCCASPLLQLPLAASHCVS